MSTPLTLSIEIEPIHAGVLARLLGELGQHLAGLVGIHNLLDLGALMPALGNGENTVAGLEDATGDLTALLAHQPGRDRGDPSGIAALLVLICVLPQVLG